MAAPAPEKMAGLMVFVVAFGLLDLATVPPVIALCREFYGEDSAIVFGWVNASHQIGAALAAFLGGVARDTFGSYDFVWVLLGAACAAAALLSLVIRRAPSTYDTASMPVDRETASSRQNTA